MTWNRKQHEIGGSSIPVSRSTHSPICPQIFKHVYISWVPILPRWLQYLQKYHPRSAHLIPTFPFPRLRFMWSFSSWRQPLCAACGWLAWSPPQCPWGTQLAPGHRPQSLSALTWGLESQALRKKKLTGYAGCRIRGPVCVFRNAQDIWTLGEEYSQLLEKLQLWEINLWPWGFKALRQDDVLWVRIGCMDSEGMWRTPVLEERLFQAPVCHSAVVEILNSGKKSEVTELEKRVVIQGKRLSQQHLRQQSVHCKTKWSWSQEGRCPPDRWACWEYPWSWEFWETQPL